MRCFWLRRMDRSRRRLQIPAGLTDGQQAFQMATQYALLAERPAIDAEVEEGGFSDPFTRALAR